MADFKTNFQETSGSFNSTFQEPLDFSINFREVKEVEVFTTVPSDWDETDENKMSYIKNKPNHAGSNTIFKTEVIDGVFYLTQQETIYYEQKEG